VGTETVGAQGPFFGTLQDAGSWSGFIHPITMLLYTQFRHFLVLHAATQDIEGMVPVVVCYRTCAMQLGQYIFVSNSSYMYSLVQGLWPFYLSYMGLVGGTGTVCYGRIFSR